MQDRVLSPHFRESEFRCTCGCGFFAASIRLISALEELRVIVQRPIKVTSGARCAKKNRQAKGAKNSQHLTGDGCDIWVRGMTMRDLAIAAERVEAFRKGGIGTYSAHIHVDVRGRKARWKSAAA